jgi:hypothetical protein
VSDLTRIRLPLKADPSQMDLNSYLSVFQETGSECRARGFVSLHKLAKKTKNKKDGSVSHSTRIRLPLKADPSQMNLNSYLLTLTQKHLKIQNVGSVWLSIKSVLL